MAFLLGSGVINIARADVCFLPDSEGCEMVPYEEYDGTPNYPRNCFATKEEAMSARTDSLDSYYQNGDMWCLKQSCTGYNVASMKPGLWDCQNCNVPQSLNYNKYKCSCDLVGANPKSGYTIDLERCEEKPNACPSNASTDCVPDECHKCNSISSVNPVYSGGKECLVYNTVDAHCPDGYVPDKPSSKCYSTQDMLCGEGKCYQAATTIPDCSEEGKQLSDDNGACWCSCKDGYHDDNNGSCVLNQCATGVAENTCGTGYTFASNNTSFTNTNGDTIRCGSCEKNVSFCNSEGYLEYDECMNQRTSDGYDSCDEYDVNGHKCYILFESCEPFDISQCTAGTDTEVSSMDGVECTPICLDENSINQYADGWCCKYTGGGTGGDYVYPVVNIEYADANEDASLNIPYYVGNRFYYLHVAQGNVSTDDLFEHIEISTFCEYTADDSDSSYFSSFINSNSHPYPYMDSVRIIRISSSSYYTVYPDCDIPYFPNCYPQDVCYGGKPSSSVRVYSIEVDCGTQKLTFVPGGLASQGCDFYDNGYITFNVQW